MKILLIYPYFIEARVHVDEIAAVPMGLYYVAAALKEHGHQVEIANWYNAADRSHQIKETLIAAAPDVIGFSIVHANRWGAIEIAKLAKSIDPAVTVVCGGIGATFLWRHLLTHFDAIDYIVIGEGEITLPALLDRLAHGDDLDALEKIPGLAMRRGRHVVKTAAAQPIADLDTLAPPARHYDFRHLSLTRGCPGRCTFCGSPKFWGRRVRAHSTTYFVDQLEMLNNRGVTSFFISDDTFTLRPGRVIDVCRQIIARDLAITWQAISKVNAITPDMLYWMRKAGCIQISFGVESGSPEIRDRFLKDIDDAQIERAFDLTTAHGIMARAYFIYGAPGDTWQTIEQTLDLIRRIRPMSAIFYVLDIFPGTALYDDYKARCGVDEDIWLESIEDVLYFETDPQLDQADVIAFGRHLRETFHRWLPDMAAQIVLADHPDLRCEQADFLSRLAMTFSHGDYCHIESTTPPADAARILYQRALDIVPDHRAYWGLALMDLDGGNLRAAVRILEAGLDHFPQSEELRRLLRSARTRLQ